ncbi:MULTISPECIES: UDP-2,3-diacylglucosamine diphosphatase [Marinobacter]|jgi:UDP-2,3-diacylglucosamine pyrophosphatase LpxH|uniref:Ser/Thr protein phosphatase family protein n=1 Tax=Marinobacter nauticus TaxID=2743 RepID=A0A833JWD9_MARNT|nr:MULTISPECIES: UDP-2,3-diacylglucosamine diphosphatase [Marinobacter]KAE8547390.1 Ser/Thr protein phosphatase family protein [Marinobacter nauticus]MAL32341.1 UDP-2,3-diacylglucosamine hydrolase [Marinobacter sp.]MCK5884976.1 UDP-2,3-diacylglucosamine diphosphatase [Alcanivorax sp.]HCP22173.1 UDP-2,3-diacylglucosamine hydrolase [Marinobacter nauticus]|tara:strand:- start:63 stop:914 length:852 start_codon:yes stop_codon:yes gene_type:complete
MRQYRSVFISDVHLGTADCQADYLLDFLNNIQCQTLYLVGDIVDLIAMQRRAHFPDSHRQIIHKLLELAATGTRVVYIPGNHDEFFRRFCGQTFSGIELQYKAVHTTADDRQFLVCHGDQFDQVVRCSPLMLLVGDRAHGLLLRLNRWFNALRRLQGKPYWSLAAWIKSRIGKARTFIRRFELAALTAAEKGHYHGFICGHIHSAGFLRSEEGLYCNDGDWVEHCTALVERENGRLELLHWSESPVTLSQEPETPNPELAGDARPVIDALPAAFLEQINGPAR